MALVNVMEEIVAGVLNEELKTSNCCKCKKCVDDMMAIALNKVPPKYVSTAAGQLFSRMESTMAKQKVLDVKVAVISAIDLVSAHPRHQTKFGDSDAAEKDDETDETDKTDKIDKEKEGS